MMEEFKEKEIRRLLRGFVGKDLDTVRKLGLGLLKCRPVSIFVSSGEDDTHGTELDQQFGITSIIAKHPEISSYVVYDATTYIDGIVFRVRAPKEETT